VSDYYPEADQALPLFATKKLAATARDFHERQQAQADVLLELRKGSKLTKHRYERIAADGRRLAPAVEQLRNAYGFVIDGNGTIKKPYFLIDPLQHPTLVHVSDDMKSAYYKTPHWISIRSQRFNMDAHQCVLCQMPENLQCHHITYGNLFREQMRDLMTVCERCHDRIHIAARLKFPSGIPVQYAHLLGWGGFETWLLP
jgi:hypothetical protein